MVMDQRDVPASPERILIRGSIGSPVLWIPVTVAFVAGIVWVCSDDLGKTVAGLAALTVGAAIFAAILILLYLVAHRQWLLILSDGFLVEDRAGRHEYRDSDVRDIKAYWKFNYVYGKLHSIYYSVTLWSEKDGQSDQINFAIKLKRARADLLALFIDRVTEVIHQRNRGELANGHAILGDGWSLDSSGLTVSNKRGVQKLSFREIAGAEFVEGNLSVWKLGEEAASIRISAASKNVAVLRLLLKDWIVARPEQQREPGELGRILFERKAMRWLFWILGAFTAVVTISMYAAPKGNNLLLVAFSALTFVLFLVAIWSRRIVFRCHTSGVYFRGMFTERCLRYEEVKEFAYNATRMYHNAIYTGTNLELKFDPGRLSGKKTIKYTTTVSGMDNELDHLREYASSFIAKDMLARVQRGETVEWTKHLRLSLGGLEYRPVGFLVRTRFRSCPYDQVRQAEIVNGNFQFKVEGKRLTAFRDVMSRPNFFPGLFVFNAMTVSQNEVSGGPSQDANRT